MKTRFFQLVFILSFTVFTNTVGMAQDIPNPKTASKEIPISDLKAVKNDSNGLINEAADVMYHLLVLLKSREISLSHVMAELERRTAQSGLTEKAARKT